MKDLPQPREVMLEFIQDETGQLILRESKNHDEVFVTINFSDKVKEMLGDDTHFVGEHMIQAAMAAVMHRQMDKWHANVYDEKPKRYS